MKFFALFIYRPVATILLSVAITLCGILGFRMLPVAPLPQVDFPVIMVSASLPGASPETMASSVATPLERSLGRIAGVSEMTSSSSLGSTRIILQFDFDRDINGAARDVQAAINAAQSLLPSGMPSRPTYRKANPSDAPIMILTLTSDTYSQGELYDFASTQLAPTISQIDGVGDVDVGGSSLPAVRVGLNPQALFNQGVSLDDVRTAISNANVRKPQGALEDGTHRWQIQTNDELKTAAEYQPLIIHYNNGAAVRLGDVATVTDSVQDVRNAGMTNAKPAILLMIRKLPEANIIQTVDSIRAKLPELQETIPAAIDLQIAQDRSPTIRASLEEVEQTLIISVALVILVVFLFLRSGRATIIPAVAVPVSLIGTFAAMYLCGFSLNNLSLMALTIATGFVVDDAIVVLENVERIMEEDKLSPVDATLKAMQEVTGPVIAIVLVLCAVFIPVAFLGGLAGQMYKQFAITIAMSVVISGIVALTLTPALCAVLLKPGHQAAHKFFDVFNNWFARMTGRYTRGVAFFVRRSALGLLVCGGIVAVTLGLFRVVPGGLVPDEDQGYVIAVTLLPDGASLSRTQHATQQVDKLAMAHPAVTDVLTFTGFDLLTGSFKTNSGASFLTLKDWKERHAESDQAQSIVGYMFGAGMGVKEAMVLAFNPPPISGMSSTGGFEVYVQNRGNGGSKDLAAATQKLIEAAHKRPELGQLSTTFSADVPQLFIELDREKAKTYGVPINDVFDTMQSTFGELYVNDFNKLGRTFRVQLQSEADFRSRPEDIRNIHVRSQSGEMIPLTALVTVKQVTGPEIVERYNIFPSAKIVGGPAPGYSSGQAIAAMEELAAQVLSDDYSLAWTGSAFQEKQTGGASTLVFVFALVMVFLILAAQYERWNLPIAVLLAVPFAVFGAISANWLRGMANDVYFQIALVTLIGLAAKNAILIVEFAMLKLEEGLSLADAAIAAARLRFRPIIMTSLAFVLGCVPLAISTGAGASSRHSIGTGVIGGMLAATFIATFFIPMLFMLIMRLGRRPAPAAVSQHDGKDA